MNNDIKEILKDENVNGFILSDERYIELKNYITDLEKRCKKAIEYIKSYNLPEDLGHFGEAPMSIRELRELLNILNGSE